MKKYLKSSKILLKDCGEHVRQVSGRLKKASLAPILKMGRMVQYLAPSVDKSAVAHKIAAEQNISSGLVCAVTSVEPCRSFPHRLQSCHPTAGSEPAKTPESAHLPLLEPSCI